MIQAVGKESEGGKKITASERDDILVVAYTDLKLLLDFVLAGRIQGE